MVTSLAHHYLSFIKRTAVSLALVTFAFLVTAPTTFAAAEIDLASTNNFSFKFEGTSSQGSYAFTSNMADLNGDGKTDLLVATRAFSGGGPDSLFIIYSDLLSTFSPGSTIDLSSSGNYNVRFNTTVSSGLATYNATTGDFDGDHKTDLAVTEAFGGSADEGAVFVIRNPIFANLTGTGNTLELSSGSSFNVRIDQVDLSNQHFGIVLHAADLNNNGKDDLLIGSDFTTYSINHAGSLYIIYDDLLASYSSGTGNVISINSTTSFSIRIDGPALANGPNITNGDFKAVDINNNGYKDIAIGCWNCSNNSRTRSGSVYVLYDSLIRPLSGTGNTLALGNSTSYNLRFDGALAEDYLGKTVDFVDLNNDGRLDFLSGAPNATRNGRSNSGAVFAIDNSIFQNIGGTGNSIDLATSTNWTVRVDGAAASDKFGARGGAADFDSDGKTDFFFGAGNADYNGRADSGSIYLLYNPLFGGMFGTTGNTIDLASSTNYTVRYDAPNASAWLTGFPSFETRPSLQLDDLNNDGKLDVFARYNNSSGEATTIVIYNFPHSLSLNTFTTASGNTVNASGTVSAPKSLTNIQMVQYSLDTNTPSGANWQNCVPADGAFGSKNEEFNCTVTINALLGGSHHTIYIRGQDTNGSYTAVSQYGTFNFWKDYQPQSNANCPPNFKFCIHGGPHLTSAQTIVSSFITDVGSLGKVIVDKTTHKDDFFVTIASQPLESLPTLSLPLSKSSGVKYPWQQGKNIASDIMNFSAVSSFNGYPIIATDNPFVIQLSYDTKKMATTSPTSLKLSYFDIASRSWKNLNNPLVVDSTNNTISSTTHLFSLYALTYPNGNAANGTSLLNSGATPSEETITTPPAPTAVTPAAPKEPINDTSAPAKTAHEPKRCFLLWCF